MTVITPSDFDDQFMLLIDSLDFPEVLSQPETQQIPEGQLHTFCFENGYGAHVMRNRSHSAQSFGEQRFELCLLDCSRRPHRPTFEHPLYPDIRGGLSHAEVSALLVQAERLPRHPNLTHHDEQLLGEDF
ncbi:hypothetical protein [Deinococcus sp.]|uniref:hypothetical protein n=1 Tax=Deinococcus sp. TaxID=47478 RepID=UPI003CC53F53